MPEVTVIATIVAKSKAVERVKSELLRLVEPTRKEEGCLQYALHCDNASPASFVFYERWESANHLKRHMETDHFKEILNAIEGLTEEPLVQEMTQLG